MKLDTLTIIGLVLLAAIVIVGVVIQLIHRRRQKELLTQALGQLVHSTFGGYRGK